VIERLKNPQGILTCPICWEATPSALLIVPCGHEICQECLPKLINQEQINAMANGEDGAQSARCPHCRGPLNPSRVVDWQVFKSIHMPDEAADEFLEDIEKLESQISTALGGAFPSDGSDDASDSDSEDEYESDEDSDLGGFIVDDDEVEDFSSNDSNRNTDEDIE